MTDPADQPDGPAADADSDAADDADLQHAHEVGTAMIEQLGVLLDRWLAQISHLVEQGIDPTPLLQGLARLMRSAADQLDPTTSSDPTTPGDE